MNVPLRNRNFMVAMSLGLAVFVALVVMRPGGISVASALLGVCILAVSGTPLVYHMTVREIGVFPIFPVAGAFYAICFGIPVFLLSIIWPKPGVVNVWLQTVRDRQDLVDPAILLIILVALICWVCSFFAAKRFLFKKLPAFTLPKDFDSSRLVVLAWVLLASHMAFSFVPSIRALLSVGQFLQPALFVALGVFFVLRRRRKIGIAQTAVVFAGILPILIVQKASEGLLTPIMLLALFFFFLISELRSRRLLVLAVGAALFLGAAYLPITQFRLASWSNPEFQDAGFAEKATMMAGYFLDTAGSKKHLTRSFHMTAKRVSLLPVFSYVTMKTPNEVPFWKGETYKPLLTSLIPRAVWPEKPEERSGKRFADRYSLISPKSQTSINVPWITEMYVNFGIIGILVGMSLVGVFLAFLDKFFNSPGMTRLEAVVGLSIVFPLSYPESNFSVMCGSLLPLTICLWLYFRIGLVIVPGLEKRLFERTKT